MIRRGQRAQSFVEFALVLPMLIIMLLGVVEVTLFIGSYINILDLTRTAARFASNRDPFSTSQAASKKCSESDKFNFFFDTSCIFSPQVGLGCTSADAFCGGFNSTLQLKPTQDDILIYVFTEADMSRTPTISDNGRCNASSCDPWVWSNDPQINASPSNNWKKDCKGNLITPAVTPHFTRPVIQSYLSTSVQNMNKGFVVVEAVYCYHQVLNIPIFSNFFNPLKIDTYSIMPLPAAQPTLVPLAP